MKKILISSIAILVTASAHGALIGYWNFDNDTLVETSGFKPAGTHDGQAVATIAYGAGPSGFGRGLSLGGNSAVRVLNSNSELFGSNGGGPNPTYQNTFDSAITASPMTISVWFNGMPNTWGPFVSKLGEGNEPAAYGYQLRKHSTTSGTTLTLRGTNGADDPRGSITGLDDGAWHHLVGVWDRAAGNRYLYVDGVLDTGGSITDGSDTGDVRGATNEYLVFGGRDQGGSIGNFGAGMLDEVRIYDEALSQAQVQALMVPEPSVSLLVGICGLGLLIRRRR